VDAIVRTALEIAVRTTEGDPLDGELKGRAGTLPYRIADLEARLAASGAVDTSLVADVHHDLKTNTVLHVATGNAEDMAVLARTAAGEAPQLAMGVVIPYYEFMQDAPNRLTDGAWRKRLAERAPPRTSVAGAYALERPEPAAPPR
jgi:hypothetical protein